MEKISTLQTNLVFDNLRQPYFKVTVGFADGQQLQKTLSFTDYKELIGIAVREEKEPYFSIPDLPQYYYRGGITAKEDTFWVSFFLPKGVRQLGYSPTNEFFRITYPGLFFVISVNKGVVVQKHCYAVADGTITENSLLYKYPFGNVSQDGSICMGNCSTKIRDFKSSHEFVQSFLLGKDAGHYYSPGEMAKPKVPLRDLFHLVMEKKDFPEEWLMPVVKRGQPRQLKVSDVLGNMREGKNYF